MDRRNLVKGAVALTAASLLPNIPLAFAQKEETDTGINMVALGWKGNQTGMVNAGQIDFMSITGTPTYNPMLLKYPDLAYLYPEVSGLNLTIRLNHKEKSFQAFKAVEKPEDIWLLFWCKGPNAFHDMVPDPERLYFLEFMHPKEFAWVRIGDDASYLIGKNFARHHRIADMSYEEHYNHIMKIREEDRRERENGADPERC